MSDDISTRAGFAAIIGAPNAGKSTLVNRLVGSKVAIVTHKVQTTRFPVRGVMMHENAQIVLVDTPGIFSAKRRLDRAMVKSAWLGAEEADAIVHLIDASAWIAIEDGNPTGAQKKSVADDERIIRDLKQLGRSVYLALNKVDLFEHLRVLPLIERFEAEGVYSEFFMISALNGEGVESLADILVKAMPEGPYLYPEDQAGDLTVRLLAAEITREKLMLRLHEELPYQLTVETESWEEQKNGSVKVRQAIIVGRESHKGMVLGKQGRTIKQIGQMAREELSELLGRKVHLFLFVKVDEKWTERRDTYANVGLEFDV